MRVLATFPGRFGDVIWALPTIRALSRRLDQPIDLQICAEFANLVPLLTLQPYLGMVYADPSWAMGQVDNWHAPRLEGEWDAIIPLGYHGWPECGLPFEVLRALNRWSSFAGSKWTRLGNYTEFDLDLRTHWITAPDPTPRAGTLVGFTEAWFELKLGLLYCVAQRWPQWLTQLTPPGSRWTTEVPHGDTHFLVLATDDWIHLANLIVGADCFFGDCSALHVLAVALGIPAIICEPMEARWNPIFWPLGKIGPQVTCVLGHDGNPTFDARACAAALADTLTRS